MAGVANTSTSEGSWEGDGRNHLTPEKTAETRYKELSSGREFYLEAARDCCKYTIPTLLTFFDTSVNSSWEKIETPYQGIGARGVNNLASKLLTAITPVNIPMFRLVVENDTLIKARLSEDSHFIAELEQSLARYSEAVLKCIKASGDYAYMYEVWQLLLVSGNVLIVDPPDNGNIRVYSLRDYVLKRDRSGNVIEIILKEQVSKKALPDDMREKIDSSDMANNDLPSESLNKQTTNNLSSSDELDIYTCLNRNGDIYDVWQECKGAEIAGTRHTYPLVACPFIPIRMYAGSGEDYSRSYVSNYLGDLKSAEGLCQSTIEGGAMAAKHIYMVRPDGLTDIKDIEDTPNGGVIYGRADDVGVMQSNKAYDLKFVSEEASKIERRLAQAFLLFDGGVRDSERVTAEEIKTIATELEGTLGGVYSVMCHAFQIPYIKRKIWKLQKLKKLSPLDKDITPIVVTGFEALGLSGDKERLLEFMGIGANLLGEKFQGFVDTKGFLKRLSSVMNVDTVGFLKSDETLAAEEQAAQAVAAEQQQMMMQQSLVDKALPAAIGNSEGLANVL